ncbi:MAG: hypothetical protein CVU43_24765 [Chloroflexi bacterium HGW-Chloroflexi-5]|jgi:hypothetical protein|nr:MAG: hypothetical protein CVU43_24765 [Chloroflexi bacterium HGW-Chloroflexi-5]
MKKSVFAKPEFEFLPDHSILINHVNLCRIKTPSSYILNLLELLDEAERLKATKLLVMASSEVFHMDFKMHEWVSRYLFPQMKHIGVLKIAFCVKSLPDSMAEHKATFGQQPEIGVFTSMPEAKAWIMGVLDKTVSLSFDSIDPKFLNKNIAS